MFLWCATIAAVINHRHVVFYYTYIHTYIIQALLCYTAGWTKVDAKDGICGKYLRFVMMRKCVYAARRRHDIYFYNRISMWIELISILFFPSEYIGHIGQIGFGQWRAHWRSGCSIIRLRGCTAQRWAFVLAANKTENLGTFRRRFKFHWC